MNGKPCLAPTHPHNPPHHRSRPPAHPRGCVHISWHWRESPTGLAPSPILSRPRKKCAEGQSDGPTGPQTVQLASAGLAPPPYLLSESTIAHHSGEGQPGPLVFLSCWPRPPPHIWCVHKTGECQLMCTQPLAPSAVFSHSLPQCSLTSVPVRYPTTIAVSK